MSCAPAEAAAPAKDGEDLINLGDKLDKSACYARNENSSYPWTNLFIGDSRLGMQSDADEQLIIHLTFQEFMRVRNVIVFCMHNIMYSFLFHVLYARSLTVEKK